MSAAAEFAGGLKERVTIEYQAPGTDALGIANGAWQTRGCVWASLVPSTTDGAAYAGDAMSAAQRYHVTVRRRADVRVGDRLIWRGRALIVLNLAHDPAQPDRMTFLVEQMR